MTGHIWRQWLSSFGTRAKDRAWHDMLRQKQCSVGQGQGTYDGKSSNVEAKTGGQMRDKGRAHMKACA